MKSKEYFNEEEIKCLRKISRQASMVKSSLISICISFFTLIIFGIDDFIRSDNNVSRNFVGKSQCIIILTAFFLILFGVFYLSLSKNLRKNKIWKNILEKIYKISENNVELDDINANTKSAISEFLLGDIMSSSDELKELGKTVEIISGVALFSSIIKSCSKITIFIKNVSKAFGISISDNYKLYVILVIILNFLIVILNVYDTINDIKIGNGKDVTIVDSLTENCNQSTYCNSIELNDEDIIIDLNNDLHADSKLRLDENKSIEGIKVSLNYDVALSKIEIVDDVNLMIQQIMNLVNKSNITCAHYFVCQEYQLSNEFINKFYNMSDNDNIVDDYILEEAGKSYVINTNAYISEYYYDDADVDKVYDIVVDINY